MSLRYNGSYLSNGSVTGLNLPVTTVEYLVVSGGGNGGASGGSQIRGLGRAIEKGLSEYGGGKVTLVEEPQFAGSNGALKIALDMPTEFWAEFRTNRELATQGMSGLVS